MSQDPAAARHLAQAIAAIDAQLGEGYAAKHPELVASLVQSSTIEAAVSKGYGAHQEALGVAQSLTAQICETLLRLKPKFFGG
ncbi:hypothetical protein SAMN05421666_2938 [Roseovarius nanhaiticus]|uniref:Uncharacterized protein n=1 Tax=Roseovarius nanhaiticus TaxID=573024 RepID=A0A1N7HFS3_9RHOB|nr:hypothetical protein [Roseovarius nanhaiticus]SEK97283.1 hypothetical protein SAMN05216208_2377 [Roseovarius nanhaiticus]SIS23736.1 hypothetical protein SAMN05421666_2938 [Roseovarius nanhaiticus]